MTKFVRPNLTKPNSQRGGNVTGSHLEPRPYGATQIKRLLPSLVAEPVPTVRKLDRRRAPCVHDGCSTPHLKGSDYCYEHDTGQSPRTRHSD